VEGDPAAEQPQRRVARNMLVRSVAEVVAKAASLAFFVVLARELGTEGYGAFSFALALTGALLLIAGFGTDELIAREAARDHTRAPRFLADVAALKTVTAVALLAVALAIVFAGGYSAETRLATLLVGIGVALEVLAKSWQAIFQAYERLDLASVCVILQRCVTAAAGIGIVVAGGGLVGAALAFAAGSLLGLAAAEYGVRGVLRVRRARPSLERGLRLLRLGVPIGIAGLLFTLLLRVDVMMLSFLGGNAEVGIYSAAFRLVEGCQFLSWVFGGAMLPWLARGVSPERLRRGFMLGLKFEAAMLLPIALVFTCFAEPIIDLLYGAEYAGSVLPLQLLGLTVAFYGLQSFSGIVLIARDAPGTMTKVVAVVAAQNVICNAVFIPLAGADGAAAVQLSSHVLLALLAVRAASRRAGGLQAGRAFAGPALAAAALLAVALLVPLPALPAGALALLAYAGVLAAVELGAHRDDVDAYLRALPVPLPARLRLASR
jgi:O-antigen/teichoic acid export membrane protein